MNLDIPVFLRKNTAMPPLQPVTTSTAERFLRLRGAWMAQPPLWLLPQQKWGGTKLPNAAWLDDYKPGPVPRRILVRGKEYPSFRSACKALKLTPDAIYRLLNGG